MNAVEVFKSLSEPVRLRLLHLLAYADNELCVCDLVTILDAPQGTVSRHLSYLRHNNWVTDRRSGTWIYYKIAPTSDPLRKNLIQCLLTCMDDDPVLSKDLELYTQLKANKKIAVCNAHL